ncbi:MAG: lactonase family protein [Cyclobacteriaceae bacterium]
MRLFFTLFISLILITSATGQSDIFVGTFTDGSKGLFRFSLEGQLISKTPVNGSGYQAINRAQRIIYTLSWSSESSSAVILAYKISDKGLDKINEVITNTKGLAHVNFDPINRLVGAVSYGGGDVVVYHVLENGAIGELKGAARHIGGTKATERHDAAHPHSIFFNKGFAYVPDLGMDRIAVYDVINEFKEVSSTASPAGGGPRHLAFHPSGKYAYVNDEVASSVSMYHLNEISGELTIGQTISTLPTGFIDFNKNAQVLVSPDGRFLYVSNRGHASIATFSIEQASGTLSLIGFTPVRGKTPRNFNISPDGKVLIVANKDSSNLVFYNVDRQSGKLAFSGKTFSVPNPGCVTFF